MTYEPINPFSLFYMRNTLYSLIALTIAIFMVSCTRTGLEGECDVKLIPDNLEFEASNSTKVTSLYWNNKPSNLSGLWSISGTSIEIDGDNLYARPITPYDSIEYLKKYYFEKGAKIDPLFVDIDTLTVNQITGYSIKWKWIEITIDKVFYINVENNDSGKERTAHIQYDMGDAFPYLTISQKAASN